MAMQLVCYININGVDTLKKLTTVTGTEATFVKNKPGVGKPFLMFATLSGSPLAADFSHIEGQPDVPLVSDDTNVNQAAINTMLADPAPYRARLSFP